MLRKFRVIDQYKATRCVSMANAAYRRVSWLASRFALAQYYASLGCVVVGIAGVIGIIVVAGVVDIIVVAVVISLIVAIFIAVAERC